MNEIGKARKGWLRRNTRRILGTSLLLALGSAGFFYYFWWLRPMGEGPAGPEVPLEPFQSVWTERPVLLLGIGDSVTAGFGADPGRSYFDLLVSNPTNEFPGMESRSLERVLPRLQFRNRAISGSTSLDHWAKVVQRLEPQLSNVFGIVVLTTGGNDIIHSYGRTPPREGAMYGASVEQAAPWIRNFEQRLDAMMDRIELSFPGGCRIFLANIYDPTDGLGDAWLAGLPRWPAAMEILDAYNRVIADCAQSRASVELVDIRAAFWGHGIHCRQFWRKHWRANDPHYWFHENLEDPNDRGYDALRRLFLDEMRRTLPSILNGSVTGTNRTVPNATAPMRMGQESPKPM